MKRLISFTIVFSLLLTLFISAPFPVGATGDAYSIISTGYGYSLAIKSDGSLWAWGYNDVGQLGDGTKVDRHTPVKIMDGVAQVSAGSSYSLAIKSDGSLWAWGYNGYFGVFGNGMEGDSTVPVKVMDNVAQISAGFDHVAAIKSDGSLWMWGCNYNGQLGEGTKEVRSRTPVKVMDQVAQVAVGKNHTVAVKNDGSLWAWGSNSMGQIGDGTKVDRRTPVKVMDQVTQVAAGNYHTLAIKNDGSLWGWGSNEIGQLGGTTYTTPTPVKIMENVIQVTAGTHNTLAIKRDGSLWAWGGNYDGKLGNGTTRHRRVPVKIMDNVAQVSAGDQHTLAIKRDGSLWAWGDNRRGTLGDGTTENRLAPVKVMESAMLPNASARLPITPAALTAIPSPSKVVVDGKSVAFDAYNISGSNYFKLRDIAYVLSGTKKQFDVAWDGANNAISLKSGAPYTAVGGEMAQGDGRAKDAMPTSSRIYFNGRELNLAVYNIGGSNYFKLRDLMKALNIYVGYDDATRAITLDTSKGYHSESAAHSYSNYLASPHGSAKLLEGKSILVSIFLTLDSGGWDSQGESWATENLGIATEFILKEAKRYGKEVELIYNTNPGSNLCYAMKYDSELYDAVNSGADNDKLHLVEPTFQSIYDFIESDVPYLELADIYGTSSIAYVVFVNTKGRSYACPYEVELLKYKVDSYHEATVVFNKGQQTQAAGSPATLAHELLHLFGAKDLYESSSFRNVRQELVEYAELNFPDEIMVRTSMPLQFDEKGDPYYDKIPQKISRITAYCLGWLDDIPELKQFPEFTQYD